MHSAGRKIREMLIERGFLISAFISAASVVLISIFIFRKGLPLFSAVSPAEFFFSSDWSPSDPLNPRFGILSFIIGSLYVTVGALIIAVPVGIASGIFLAEMAGRRFAPFLRTAVELLSGIPSVIYGLFGISFIVPLVRRFLGGSGYSVLSAALILAVMTLPTIINMTEVSVRSVPRELKEASFALGAARWQTIRYALVPAASSGIITGIVLGMGRALGETMAVLLVGGNAAVMPSGLSSMVRTLTMNIITDMAYAEGLHLTALFTTGIVLFAFILLLNMAVQLLVRSSAKKREGAQ